MWTPRWRLYRRREPHADLDHTRGTEHAGIVPGPPNQLEAEGKPLRTQADRHADRRPAERIERAGEVRPADTAQRWRGLRLRRGTKQIDLVEYSLALTAENSTGLLGAHQRTR